MNIGLIGLQKSGKTTIFNALTGQSAETSEFASRKSEPNLAVVDVDDERVSKLSELYLPKKTVYATVEFIDFAGLTSGAAEHGIFSGEAMQLIKTADALCIVLRNFNDDVIDQTCGMPDPAGDLEIILTELILSDQIVVERRLERIRSDMQRGKKTPSLASEEKIMERILAHLDGGKPLLELDISREDRKIISGFQFMSGKPVFAVLNSREESYGKNKALAEKVSLIRPLVEFSGSFEMELSRLSDDGERSVFMEDMGITESARKRLTTFAYRTLGYISFFTVGEDEVRAWTIIDGENAVDAAGTIHSDLARGFIRAEVFTYGNLIELGSEKAVKSAGKHRLEGKTYKVCDGDILNIRFSV